MLAPPLLGGAIAAHGWRTGYLILAGTVAVAAVVIAFLLKPRKSVDRSNDGAKKGLLLRDAIAGRAFWLMALGFFCVALAAPGLIVHIVPYLTDQGLSASTTAAIASSIGAFLIIARILTGLLLDKFFAPYVAAAAMLLSTAGFLVLALGGARFALIGAVSIGVSFGSEVNLVGYLAARYYGLRAYGEIYGLLYTCLLAGTALSPIAYGFAFDKLGSYHAAIEASALLLGISAVLFLALPPFELRPGRS
jgi:predicted MFS family arabinose efflux permease